MKKILSLVLALSMVLLACSAAFAADGDPVIKVTGLEGAESVDYYKVIEWDEAVGWKWAAPYAGAEGFTAELLKEITGTPAKAAVPAQGTEGEQGYVPAQAAVDAVAGKITAATANKIAAVENNNKLSSGTLNKASGEWSATVAAGNDGTGLYMVVPTGSKDVLFNPVFVAANHGAKSPISFAVSANTGSYADESMAKKTTINVDKTADKYSFNGFVGDNWTAKDGTKPGDTITFTIKTTAPKFAASYTDPVFKISDQVSAGMKILKNTIEVTGAAKLAESTNYTLTFDDADPDHFVIALTDAYLAGLTANQEITITYQAEVTNEAPLTINVEDNTVEVNFSNSPDDEEGHGCKHDKTKHWTFSLDATLFGNEEYTTSELVKVGLNADGTEKTETKTYSNKTKAHALAGATFELRKGSTVIRKVTTGEDGYIKFDGLDVGTYTLVETAAPSGYVRDTAEHTVEISAVIKHDAVETAEDHCEYLTDRLESYSVKVDGTTSTYTFDNGTQVVTEGDKTTKIGNTEGLELPSTGGIGTTIFYVLGGLLVVGAAIVLVARRKAHD